MIKALEIIAEGEQELLIKEAKEKEALARERSKSETGSVTSEGMFSPASDEKKKADDVLKDDKKAGMNEILKLGVGKSSPKGSNKKSNHLAPAG